MYVKCSRQVTINVNRVVWCGVVQCGVVQCGVILR